MKKALRIPVITVGRINHPSWLKILSPRGRRTWWPWVARSWLIPIFPGKPLRGRKRRSVSASPAMRVVTSASFSNSTSGARSTPPRGGKKRFPAPKAAAPKRVVVIGAGPAGMEAAHAAWERGHEVLLMETSPEVGGQLNLASLPPGRKEIENFRSFLRDRLQRSDVKILKAKSATALLCERIRTRRGDSGRGSSSPKN